MSGGRIKVDVDHLREIGSACVERATDTICDENSETLLRERAHATAAMAVSLFMEAIKPLIVETRDRPESAPGA